MAFYLWLLKLPSHHLSSYQREERIIFKKTFQKTCMNNHFLTSSQSCFQIVIMLKLRSCVGPNLSASVSVHPIVPSFQMASNISSSTLCTRLDLPYPMAHGLFWCICGQAIDLTRIHQLCCAHGESTQPHMM
jgi:hypothetical protein